MDCQTQICFKCKLEGSHSQPPFKDHNLISVKECYDFLKKNRAVRTPQMDSLSKKIKEHKRTIDVKAARMNEQFDSLEASIILIYRNLMKKLLKLKARTVLVFESMSSMLETKLRELRWMEYFIKFQVDYVAPEIYINNFFTHQKMQKKLYEDTAFLTENLVKLHSNYKIVGDDLDLVDKKIWQEKKDKEAEEKRTKLLLQEKKW